MLRVGSTPAAAASALGLRVADLWDLIRPEVDFALAKGKTPEQIARRLGVEVSYVHDREAVRRERSEAARNRELSRGRGWHVAPDGTLRWMPPVSGTELRR